MVAGVVGVNVIAHVFSAANESGEDVGYIEGAICSCETFVFLFETVAVEAAWFSHEYYCRANCLDARDDARKICENVFDRDLLESVVAAEKEYYNLRVSGEEFFNSGETISGGIAGDSEVQDGAAEGGGEPGGDIATLGRPDPGC